MVLNGIGGVVTGTDAVHFASVVEQARAQSDLHASNVSEFEPSDGARYYVVRDASNNAHVFAGFAVRADGELTNVFSTRRGHGDYLVKLAINRGAKYLDCFVGYLDGLYARHGFRTVKVVENWTPGGPDVAYMALKGYASRHGVDEPAW